MKERHRLIVFAREPQIGKVKTRFHTRLTPAQTFELYSAFVQDVIEPTYQVPADSRAIYYTGAREPEFLRRFPDFQLIRQRGTTLGERMQGALSRARRDGYTATVIVGTDCLSITPEIYKTAFALLKDHDVVIGPSHDGGYYLIGLRDRQPALFSEIPWGSDTVFMQTMKKARTLSLKTCLLPEKSDLDDWPTLQRFMRGEANRRHAPRTTDIYLRLRKENSDQIQRELI